MRSGPRPWVVATLVLLGHALLWLLFDGGQRSATSKPASGLISLRLVAEPMRPAPPRPQARPGPMTLPRARLSMPAPAPGPAETDAAAPPPVIGAVPLAAAAPASAPLPALLDNEATRSAVRQAARSLPLTAAAPAENSQQRLGREISQSADGDCLKGEYAGGGMGLLSAPFWLLAEARGKCRR